MEWIELKEHHQEIVLSHMHFQKDLTAALMLSEHTLG